MLLITIGTITFILGVCLGAFLAHLYGEHWKAKFEKERENHAALLQQLFNKGFAVRVTNDGTLKGEVLSTVDFFNESPVFDE